MKRKFKVYLKAYFSKEEYGEIEIDQNIIDFAKTTWMGKLGSGRDENIVEHIAYEIFVKGLTLDQIEDFEDLNYGDVEISEYPTISIGLKEEK